jgi:N-acetylneuraminic acid mutarotase
MNIRNIFKIVTVGLIGMTDTSLAIGDSWARKADMPTARICPYTSVVDGKVYAIGGARAINRTYLATVEEYDPATNIWTLKTDMPTSRNGHATAVGNSKIYVIGGDLQREMSGAIVEEYNPATDTWAKKTDMPSRRTFLSACSVGEKIYVLGGVTAGFSGADWHPAAIEVYHPVTDIWTRKGNTPTLRAGAAVAVVDGKIYVIGGETGSLHTPAISTVEKYDPATDTWARKADMPTARMFLSTCVVGGKIYAIGGGTWNGAIYSTVEMYDTITDTWTTRPDMTTRRLMLSTCSVHEKIYAIGGTLQWYPCPGISTVEEYDTHHSTNSWVPPMSMRNISVSQCKRPIGIVQQLDSKWCAYLAGSLFGLL